MVDHNRLLMVRSFDLRRNLSIGESPFGGWIKSESWAGGKAIKDHDQSTPVGDSE